MSARTTPATLTPCLLAAAPELGVLRITNLALQQLSLLLYAEHPTLLMDDGPRHRDPPSLREARSLLTGISGLMRRLTRYERVVVAALIPDARDGDGDGDQADLPF